MPYITVKRVYSVQLTLDDILSSAYASAAFSDKKTTATITRWYEKIPPKLNEKFNYDAMGQAIVEFNKKHDKLFSEPREKLYRHFTIPKRSGGLRPIDEPLPDLMNALRELGFIFENVFCALYHTSAYAYVPGRCVMDVARRHVHNESRWYLKTDFTNFFGEITVDFTMDMFAKIFPFNVIVEHPVYGDELRKAVSLAFLNGGLPQGTPLSPMLTNIVMIPFDHLISNRLRSERFVYTRYADDIQISHRNEFNHQDVVRQIEQVAQELNAPLKIKPSKTRYGSNAGENWVLGLMLNRENNITVGWKRKEMFRAMVSNYAMDKRNNHPWETHDIAVLDGNISYMQSVEPEYTDGLIQRYNHKHKMNIRACIRRDLKRGYWVPLS